MASMGSWRTYLPASTYLSARLSTVRTDGLSHPREALQPTPTVRLLFLAVTWSGAEPVGPTCSTKEIDHADHCWTLERSAIGFSACFERERLAGRRQQARCASCDLT